MVILSNVLKYNRETREWIIVKSRGKTGFI